MEAKAVHKFFQGKVWPPPPSGIPGYASGHFGASLSALALDSPYGAFPPLLLARSQSELHIFCFKIAQIGFGTAQIGRAARLKWAQYLVA